jgi:predicted RND superfamily exporter protein
MSLEWQNVPKFQSKLEDNMFKDFLRHLLFAVILITVMLYFTVPNLFPRLLQLFGG